MQDEVEYFFGIEPYKTYRDYFNIYTAFPVSTESGVGSINTIRYNRFNTTFTGGVGLKCDYDEMFNYVLNAPTVTRDNLCQSLIIVIPNSTDYAGITQMWEDGTAIAFCPKSTYGYPLDSRGVIQHEAGGHGFGKLGDEYIYHNAFIDACSCTCCGHVDAILGAQSLGWYDNLSITGKTNQVPWSHLIYDPRYSDIVDIYEGGYMHSRGVFRSEQNSCMNNDIPYYSTISRESIVKRIKKNLEVKRLVLTTFANAINASNSVLTTYLTTSVWEVHISKHYPRTLSRNNRNKLKTDSHKSNVQCHRKSRYGNITSTGFCFFSGNVSDGAQRLNGIVDFDVLLTVEVSPVCVRQSQGVYADWANDNGATTPPRKIFTEYCAKSYSRDRLCGTPSS